MNIGIEQKAWWVLKDYAKRIRESVLHQDFASAALWKDMLDGAIKMYVVVMDNPNITSEVVSKNLWQEIYDQTGFKYEEVI